MSIRINPSKCVGCKKCSFVCPGNLICMKDKKAEMVYPDECWGCTACLKECVHGAIEFFLQKDIGGTGGYMTADVDENEITWNIHSVKGDVKHLTTNRKESNKY